MVGIYLTKNNFNSKNYVISIVNTYVFHHQPRTGSLRYETSTTKQFKY